MKVSGQVREVNATTLTLERPRNHAFKERVLAAAEIERPEVLEDGAGRVSPSPGSVMLTILFVSVLFLVSQARWQAGR